MKCEKLFAMIDSLYDEYLDVWEAICNIESPTRHMNCPKLCGQYKKPLEGR